MNEFVLDKSLLMEGNLPILAFSLNGNVLKNGTIRFGEGCRRKTPYAVGKPTQALVRP
ncbi:hypothetical protein [Desulfotignum phosphitoxidans]|uniref:hypothetical protein n=1 Tax=Desulfotignum phosphitoxidans TaxID=190898 RepID=UPI00034AEC62|nr:hypothetical protein [Desulfotignum phosphitoxidans]